MLTLVRKLVKYTSSSRGAKVTVSAWIIAVIAFSFLAPSAKDYESNSTEGSVKENRPSEITDQLVDEQFPSDDGLTALAVFHKDDGLHEEVINEIETFSEWLQSDDKPDEISNALPFHEFPTEIQEQMFSDDKSTLLFNFTMEEGVSASETYDVLNLVEDKWESIGASNVQFEVTGPAGITADTTSLFKNADVTLILATVALIFIILILIYRSPLLAITPLLIAGIVYGVVDRVLGVLGKYEIATIEGQATSIMLVLLFAVITDYSLFIFSRYREELQKHESKYDAMNEAIYHVSEPIFFSGGTVTLAMLSLFVAVFKPYNSFAPAFTIAVIFILIAGLTLIPALFALLGRRAFWPQIPKFNESKKQKRRLWTWISEVVVKRPARVAIIISVGLVIGVINVLPMQFSFNLLDSFPEDTSSRVGFELLEENYPAGELAPVTVLLKSTDGEVDEEFLKNIQGIQKDIEKHSGVSSVNSTITDEMIAGEADLPRNLISETNESAKFSFILEMNPYEREAINVLSDMRNNTDQLLTANGFNKDAELHLAGQTASQLDVQEMNKRDMIAVFTLVIVLLTLVLGFQTKSVRLPLLMMGTIILSYVATLGFSWVIFHHVLGYDSISYRIPVYTFVFMVALGIDYNIMLVSRIKEFAKEHVWKDAVRKGVTLTGGVISSAGLILAATFSVLMTQPIQELFLFGSIMAFGILLDTFIIRGFFLPSILILTHKKK